MHVTHLHPHLSAVSYNELKGHEGSDLTDAAAASQRAAALTEVIIVPVWKQRAASDAVQVIQTAVPRELSQRRKTAEDRKGTGSQREEKRQEMREGPQAAQALYRLPQGFSNWGLGTPRGHKEECWGGSENINGNCFLEINK